MSLNPSLDITLRPLLTGRQVFAIISWSFFPIVFFLYPETSRRTLEDMDEMFIRNPSVIVCGKRDLTQRERPGVYAIAEQERIATNVTDAKATKDGGINTYTERV